MATWQENFAFKSRLGMLMLGFTLIVMSPACLARPASWFWWASTSTDHRVCAQTAPGPGWFREAIAFKDSNCSIRVKAF